MNTGETFYMNKGISGYLTLIWDLSPVILWVLIHYSLWKETWLKIIHIYENEVIFTQFCDWEILILEKSFMCIDFKIFLNLSQNVVTLISSKYMMLKHLLYLEDTDCVCFQLCCLWNSVRINWLASLCLVNI